MTGEIDIISPLTASSNVRSQFVDSWDQEINVPSSRRCLVLVVFGRIHLLVYRSVSLWNHRARHYKYLTVSLAVVFTPLAEILSHIKADMKAHYFLSLFLCVNSADLWFLQFFYSNTLFAFGVNPISATLSISCPSSLRLPSCVSLSWARHECSTWSTSSKHSLFHRFTIRCSSVVQNSLRLPAPWIVSNHRKCLQSYFQFIDKTGRKYLQAHGFCVGSRPQRSDCCRKVTGLSAVQYH